MSYLNNGNDRKKKRVPEIRSKKNIGSITALTCYDATFARLLEHTDLDIVLVGDSLGNVVQGRSSTIQVDIDDIAYHVKCVAQQIKTPLLVADIPFACAGFEDAKLFSAAEKLMKSGAESVKIEGATPEILTQISRLVRHGIPVMGHIGLMPQSVNSVGGYRLQGKTKSDNERLVEEAKALEAAGCYAIVLEMVETTAAESITQAIRIPTIGIGSGPQCDGQILVIYDMLGLNLDFKPKFLKHFATLENIVTNAVSDYCREVTSKKFPL